MKIQGIQEIIRMRFSEKHLKRCYLGSFEEVGSLGARIRQVGEDLKRPHILPLIREALASLGDIEIISASPGAILVTVRLRAYLALPFLRSWYAGLVTVARLVALTTAGSCGSTASRTHSESREAGLISIIHMPSAEAETTK